MAEQKVRFGIIGCGYIGTRYINILTQHQACQLTALIDSDASRASDFKHLEIPFFTSAEAYFNSKPDTDALVIATPNGTHAGLAIQALDRHKHVLIEKPMALNKKDSESIIQTADRVGRKAMVVLQNRFSPVSLWLKELIDSNHLGNVFFVEINCFWNRDERYYQKDSWHGSPDMDGGTLFTQFSHFVDILYWLFGDIENMSSRFGNFNHLYLKDFQDTGSVHFEFKRGGIGCLNFSTALWDRTMESSMTILAQNGSIKVSGQYMDTIEYCHIDGYCRPELVTGYDPHVVHHVEMVDAMIKAIKEDGCTNAVDAMHSVDIIERMYAARACLKTTGL